MNRSPVAAAILAQRSRDEVLRMDFGTITATSPLAVVLDGETTATGASRNAGYSPTVDDRVAVLVQGADRVVMFAIQP